MNAKKRPGLSLNNFLTGVLPHHEGMRDPFFLKLGRNKKEKEENKMKKFAKMMLLLPLMALAACSKGSDPTISVYTRDTTSGTRDGFMTAIGYSAAKTDNSKLASGYIQVASNGDMISSVKNDVNGIGYISLSTLATSGVTGLSYEGVKPSETTVLDGTYKMTRNFNYIVRASYSDEKVGKIVEAYRAFLSTSDAKATMKQLGGILSIASSNPTWASIKANYPVTAEDNKAITIHFGGSTSVEEMAKALSKEFSPLCGNFVAEHNHTGSGDAYKRTQGSDKDSSSALDIAYASREFSSSEPAVAGTTGKMCTDAIVAVINAKNTKITTITAASLKGVYSGTITKWSELTK
jgi:phosphate transport system substrate-binding protein